jgi:O-antigen/teichoic acid export membrane protein
MGKLAGSDMRRAFWRSISWEFFLAALTVPASILLNRSLGAEGRGLLTLVQLVPTTVFTLGTCQWDRLAKGALTSGQMTSAEAWRRTKYYALILSAVFIPVGIAGSFLYEALPAGSRWLSAIYALNFPLYFLKGSLGAIFLAAGSITGQYRMNVGYQGGYLVLLTAYFLACPITVEGMLIIYVLIYAMSYLIGLAMKKDLLRGEVETGRPSLSPLRKGFVPFALETLGGRADDWAFSFFTDLATLGSYAAITALMMPMNLISNAMLNAATAKLNWRDQAAVLRYLVKSILILLGFTVLVSALGLAFGEPVLKYVLGQSFANAAWMIPWVAGIVLANAAGFQFHIALQLSGRERSYLVIQAATPAARLILAVACGAVFGSLGILVGLIANGLLRTVVCAGVMFGKSGRIS